MCSQIRGAAIEGQRSSSSAECRNAPILVLQIEQPLDAGASGIEVFLACEVPERQQRPTCRPHPAHPR